MQARFVRGEDPRKSMDIGNDRKVRKGDRVEINYKDETYTVTALDDESEVRQIYSPDNGLPESRVVREFDFIDDDGLICYAQYVDWKYPEKWAVPKIGKRSIWDYQEPKLSESINFERGRDIKRTTGIGIDPEKMMEIRYFYRQVSDGVNSWEERVNPEKMEKLLREYEKTKDNGPLMGIWATAEHYSSGMKTFTDFDYRNKRREEYERRGFTKNQYDYILYQGKVYDMRPVEELNESINFERGQDPKEALNIGKNRKWREGEDIRIYNAFEDDYWDGVVTNADYSEDPPWVQAKIYHSNLIFQNSTIHFNKTYNEWMIDE